MSFMLVTHNVAEAVFLGRYIMVLGGRPATKKLWLGKSLFRRRLLPEQRRLLLSHPKRSRGAGRSGLPQRGGGAVMKILDILFRYVVAFFALLLLWQAGAWALGPYLLPAPLDVLDAWVQSLGDAVMQEHIRSSAFRVAAAMALAFLVAFPLGILLGYRRRIDRYVSPMVFLTYPLPKIVLLPVFLTLFGLGDLSKILIIALTTGYQILVVTRDGIRQLDARYLDAFRTLGGTAAQLVRHVLVPAALPSAMTALKVSSGTAVAVLFMAESFATQRGLGFLIMDAWGRGDQLEMFCGILSMSLLGLAVYEICHVAERVLCRWKRLENRR